MEVSINAGTPKMVEVYHGKYTFFLMDDLGVPP